MSSSSASKPLSADPWVGENDPILKGNKRPTVVGWPVFVLFALVVGPMQLVGVVCGIVYHVGLF
jgi:hypothetical protein